MALTLDDYDLRLYDRLGGVIDESTLAKITTLMRYRSLNDALQQISIEAPWPWLGSSATITTVSTTKTYALPTRYQLTDAIVDTSTGNPLRRISTLEVDAFTTNARPRFYHVDGTLVSLAPTPDAVYSLSHRFRQAEPILAAPTGTPLIPDHCGRGVVDYAAGLCLRAVKATEQAVAAFEDYAVWLKRAKDEYVTAQMER